MWGPWQVLLVEEEFTRGDQKVNSNHKISKLATKGKTNHDILSGRGKLEIDRVSSGK